MFITAVPITKLFALGVGDSGGHVLREPLHQRTVAGARGTAEASCPLGAPLFYFSEVAKKPFSKLLRKNIQTVTRQGATGVPLFTTWDSIAGLGRAPIPENISGRS